MYEIMSADEAIRLIRDGDCICVNSFVGIENPTELHESDDCIQCGIRCLG